MDNNRRRIQVMRKKQEVGREDHNGQTILKKHQMADTTQIIPDLSDHGS